MIAKHNSRSIKAMMGLRDLPRNVDLSLYQSVVSHWTRMPKYYLHKCQDHKADVPQPAYAKRVGKRPKLYHAVE